MKRISLLIIIFNFVLFTFGQAPSKFNYQVVARDASGNLIANQNVSFLISIVKGWEGGPTIYIESHSVTTNPFGQASLIVGNGNVLLGSFSDIDWGLNSFYIKTGLDPTGGTMYNGMGTAQLLSVPYALYANTSGQGGGGTSYTAGTGIDITGQVINNTMPNATHTGDAVGGTALTVVRLQGMDVSPAAPATGQVLKWSGSSWAPGSDEVSGGGGGTIPAGNNKNTLRHDGTAWVASSLLTNTGERIGIGTEWPYYQLEITQNFALPASTPNAGNIYKNNELFLHSSGYESLFIGKLSGNLSTTGQDNTGFGNNSLRGMGSGQSNTGIGRSALANTVNSNNNTATGAFSLQMNQSGSDNTAVGAASLIWNVSGSNNTALGSYTLFATTASFNTAIGSSSMQMNVSGTHNSALGYRSAYFLYDGNRNTAAGCRAMYNNYSASDNTAIGNDAMFYTTSPENTAIGSKAMYNNTTGLQQVAIGFRALDLNTTGTRNTTVGAFSLINNVNGNDNAALGNNALRNNAAGNQNVGIGNDAGWNSVGSMNTFVGYNATPSPITPDLTNAAAIGANAKVNSNNKMVLGNSNVTSVGGYASWTNYSDKRLKENIHYQKDAGLSFILKLKTASYNYIEDQNKLRRDGLIAQDVEKALKELNLEFSALMQDDDPDQTLNLSYEVFVIPLINAVQELQGQIETLHGVVENQEAALQNMTKLIEELSGKVGKLQESSKDDKQNKIHSNATMQNQSEN